MNQETTSNGHPTISNDEALEWMRQYQTQKRRCNEENGVLRNIVKRAKGEGVNVVAMIATCEAHKLDPDVVRRNMQDTVRYMGLRGLPVTADDLFEGLDTSITQKSRDADDIWTAEDTGYRAGRSGAVIDDCPYTSGSELFVAWRAWWIKGQEAIARELGPDAKQTTGPRKRKARQERIPGTEKRTAGRSNGEDAAPPKRRQRRALTHDTAAAEA